MYLPPDVSLRDITAALLFVSLGTMIPDISVFFYLVLVLCKAGRTFFAVVTHPIFSKVH